METLKAGKTKLICMMGGAIRYNKTVTENFKQPIKVLLKKDGVALDERCGILGGDPRVNHNDLVNKTELRDENGNVEAILTHKVEIKDENGNVLVTLYHSPATKGWCDANVWIETDAEIDISNEMVFLNDDGKFK